MGTISHMDWKTNSALIVRAKDSVFSRRIATLFATVALVVSDTSAVYFTIDGRAATGLEMSKSYIPTCSRQLAWSGGDVLNEAGKALVPFLTHVNVVLMRTPCRCFKAINKDNFSSQNR
mmetsp:Transcript_45004/g.108832  ORF Transcript_45004/g.108832 Transcript_45004/m.108832 type:complete len:119 (-) Transcript_45004:679-1035(-)